MWTCLPINVAAKRKVVISMRINKDEKENNNMNKNASGPHLICE